MSDVQVLPLDIAVPCPCGGVVPLVRFVRDGHPHSEAECPSCGNLCFLTPAPRVA
jgi:hypothetical protein